MTSRRAEVAGPRPGEVIRYAYLWTKEHDAGREEAVKDRPCAVVLTTVAEGGDRVVFVLPISSRKPDLAALTAETGSASATYAYDANGNLTGDGTRSYTYDAEGEGRILTATVGGVMWTYRYDPLGRRYSKTASSGAVTIYLPDAANNEVDEYDGVSKLTLRENAFDALHLAPAAVLTYSSGANPVAAFNHTDRLGSVAASSAGALTGQYKYDQ
nr:hypothetical protein [uncultured Rhodopila sp.]